MIGKRDILATAGCELLRGEAIDRSAAEGTRSSTLKQLEQIRKSGQKTKQVSGGNENQGGEHAWDTKIQNLCQRGAFGLDGGPAVADMLKKLRKERLLEVDLSGYPLGNAGAHLISEFLLDKGCVISILRMAKTQMTYEGVLVLAETMKKNDSLRLVTMVEAELHVTDLKGKTRAAVNLNLSEKRIQDLDLIIVSKLLEHNTRTETLDLSRNMLLGKQSRKMHGLTSLAEALKMNKSIKALSLACNNLHSDGLQAIGGVFTYNQSITDLDLHSCELGLSVSRAPCSIGILLLCESLRLNRGLKTINLSDNNITDDESTTAIASVVACHVGLETLVIARNAMGPAAGAHLAHSLLTNNSLTSLDIAAIELRGRGFTTFLSVLRNPACAIRVLDVSMNNLVTAATTSLIEIMEKENTSILDLRAIGNSLTEYEFKRIELCCLANKQFNEFKKDLGHVNFGSMDKDSLLLFLYRVHTLDHAATLALRINPSFALLEIDGKYIPHYFASQGDVERAKEMSVLWHFDKRFYQRECGQEVFMRKVRPIFVARAARKLRISIIGNSFYKWVVIMRMMREGDGATNTTE